MDLSITKEQENPLLNRREVYFTVTFSGATPKRQEIRAMLCEKTGASADNMVIDHLKQEYGTTQVQGYAKVYKKKEDTSVELAYKIARDKPKEKSAQAGEGKTEEAEKPEKKKKPAEEKKEEKKE